MTRATVSLKTDGAKGQIIVGGADMSRIVQNANVEVGPAGATSVSLVLTAPDIEDVSLTDAEISVRGVAMPASVEMALYRHLANKHGPIEIDVTAMENDGAREFAIKS